MRQVALKSFDLYVIEKTELIVFPLFNIFIGSFNVYMMFIESTDNVVFC